MVEGESIYLRYREKEKTVFKQGWQTKLGKPMKICKEQKGMQDGLSIVSTIKLEQLVNHTKS